MLTRLAGGHVIDPAHGRDGPGDRGERGCNRHGLRGECRRPGRFGGTHHGQALRRREARVPDGKAVSQGQPPEELQQAARRQTGFQRLTLQTRFPGAAFLRLPTAARGRIHEQPP